MGPLSVKYRGFVHAELHADKAAFNTHTQSAKTTWARQKKKNIASLPDNSHHSQHADQQEVRNEEGDNAEDRRTPVQPVIGTLNTAGQASGQKVTVKTLLWAPT